MTANRPPPTRRGHILFFLVPFILFIGFTVIAFVRIINTSPQMADQVPNALAGRQVPHTVLPALPSAAVDPVFDTKNFKGRVTLVNFWGSWCPPCREEHSFLMTLANNPLFDLVGINYKDTEENSSRFLGTFGSPFRITGFDPNGRAAVDWGVYGPPETFIVSKEGIILYRHIGPLTPAAFKNKLMPIITHANEQ